MAENKKIDPELWAALPSSKKYEYWKTFPHTVYITRCGLTPSGMIYLYKEPLTIPDEWLSVTKKLDELNYMDRIIQPRICIDDSVPNGYARIGDQYFELPGAQTCTPIWSDENTNPKRSIEEIKESVDEVEPLKKYPVFVESGLRGFARWRGEALIVPVKKDEAFFIDFENPREDSEEDVLNESIENRLKDDLEKQLKDCEEKELIRKLWFGL